MQRIPLRRGTSVAIDGKSYVIGDVIGEGGFSYIYATEPGSGTDVVIKEYYPASGALRDERTQRVLPAPGQETVFRQNLAQFAREGYAGVTAARESFQTVAFLGAGGRLCRAPALEPGHVRGVRARAPVEGGSARALLRARGGPGSVLSGSAARAVRAARDGERPRGARGRPRRAACCTSTSAAATSSGRGRSRGRAAAARRF